MTAFFDEEKRYNSGEVVIVRVHDATLAEINSFVQAKGLRPEDVSVDADCDCANGDWIEPERVVEISWRE